MSKKIRTLPNPDAPRLPIVPEICDGCTKVFSISEDRSVCECYVDPSIWKNGCPMNQKEQETGSKKKINPLKASKKKSRR